MARSSDPEAVTLRTLLARAEVSDAALGAELGMSEQAVRRAVNSERLIWQVREMLAAGWRPGRTGRNGDQ